MSNPPPSLRSHPLSLMVVDEHLLFGQVIGVALAEWGVNTVGTVASGPAALDLAARAEPDVALIDLDNTRSGLSGLEIGRALTASAPNTKLIGISEFHDRNLMSEAIAAGFVGYVLKDASLEKVARVVRSAFDGEILVPKPMQRTERRKRVVDDQASLLVAQLTPREHEVLDLLVEGSGSAAIATYLGISANTVRTHVQSILSKLQVHSRLEAAAFAVKHGLAGHTRNGNEQPEAERSA